MCDGPKQALGPASRPNDTNGTGVASEIRSKSKSIPRIEAVSAVTPPMMSTFKIVLVVGLATVKVPVKHRTDEVPAAQLCSGANPIVTVQNCLPRRTNGCPCEARPFTPQSSVSVKLSWPLLFVSDNVMPSRVERLGFATVMVRVDGVEPTACGGKAKADGLSVIGGWQAVVVLTPIQTLPASAGLWRVPPPQAGSYTAYPVPANDCKTNPAPVELKVTA